MTSEFGYDHFKTSPAGQALAAALLARGEQVRQAADDGEPPLFVVADHIAEYLAYPKLARHADRLIAEWLGDRYQAAGRKPWPEGSEARLGACFYTRAS